MVCPCIARCRVSSRVATSSALSSRMYMLRSEGAECLHDADEKRTGRLSRKHLAHYAPCCAARKGNGCTHRIQELVAHALGDLPFGMVASMLPMLAGAAMEPHAVTAETRSPTRLHMKSGILLHSPFGSSAWVRVSRFTPQ